MSPFIRAKDVLTVSPLSQSSTGVGSVVAFVRPVSEKLAVHRIISRERRSYLIKGDASLGSGDLISRERILGVATRVERGGREINFGLGPERVIIAVLNRANLLPLIFVGWRLMPAPVRNFLKCRILL